MFGLSDRLTAMMGRLTEDNGYTEKVIWWLPHFFS
jgi:hypothetical protein